MPRTKMPRKKSSMRKKGQSLVRPLSASLESLPSSVSSGASPTIGSSEDLKSLLNTTYASKDDFLKAFEAYYEKKINAHKKKYQECCEYAEKLFSDLLDSYPESYLNSKVSAESCDIPDQNNDPNVNVSSGHQSRLQNKQPSEFKKPRTPRKDRTSSRKRSLSVPAPPKAPEVFKTPLNSARGQMAMIKTITPKVSNTPVSVMRRPQHGEVAFSTSGSPLLIGAVSREDIPTISVPMQDGRVFSILPDPGLPPPDLPTFDDETKKYLKTLREHLALLAPTSP